METVFDKVLVDPVHYLEEILRIPVPPPLCADFERPDKEEVITAMVSRFSKPVT